MTLCFGCGEQIEGKKFQDIKGRPKIQNKPIYDNQGQPNCISCMMYAIGMEYRKEWLRLKYEDSNNDKK